MCGPVQVGGCRARYGRESAVFIDRCEVKVGERLLAVFQIVTNAQEVDDCKERDENEERPDCCQDDEDAVTQRLTGCDWRREQDPHASRRQW